MSFDADKKAANGGGGNYPKIPPGRWNVKIARIREAKPTKNGDRQMWVFFEDDARREQSDFIPVEGAADWKLAKLLHACGKRSADCAAARLDGPDFLNQNIQSKWFLGRTIGIEVTQEPGNKYAQIEYIDASDGPGSAIGTTPPEDDEVPFDLAPAA